MKEQGEAMDNKQGQKGSGIKRERDNPADVQLDPIGSTKYLVEFSFSGYRKYLNEESKLDKGW